VRVRALTRAVVAAAAALALAFGSVATAAAAAGRCRTAARPCAEAPCCAKHDTDRVVASCCKVAPLQASRSVPSLVAVVLPVALPPAASAALAPPARHPSRLGDAPNPRARGAAIRIQHCSLLL